MSRLQRSFCSTCTRNSDLENNLRTAVPHVETNPWSIDFFHFLVCTLTGLWLAIFKANPEVVKGKRPLTRLLVSRSLRGPRAVSQLSPARGRGLRRREFLHEGVEPPKPRRLGPRGERRKEKHGPWVEAVLPNCTYPLISCGQG